MDGIEVPVGFTKEVITTPAGKEIIVCQHEKYEMRLLKLNTTPNPDKNSKIVYNAQLTSKVSDITIHAPVIQIVAGSHAGAVMIGRTANFKKHRALLSKYIAADASDDESQAKVFDEVTIPYADYMVIETMLKNVCAAV